MFSLPSMRKILPRILKQPVKRLRKLFPSVRTLKKFISRDLMTLLSAYAPPPSTGPYQFEYPIRDPDILPDINLSE